MSSDLCLVTSWNHGVSVVVPVSVAYKIDGIKKFYSKIDLSRRRKMVSDCPDSLRLVERLVLLSEDHLYIRNNLSFYVNYVHRGGRRSSRGTFVNKSFFDSFVYVSVKENILSYCLQKDLLSDSLVNTFHGLFSETDVNKRRRKKEVDELYEKTMNYFEEGKENGI